MLQPPGGGTKVELAGSSGRPHARFARRARHRAGVRNLGFEVDDVEAVVALVAADGYGLVGGIGQYEQLWRMAYVRGPEGIVVSVSQRIG